MTHRKHNISLRVRFSIYELDWGSNNSITNEKQFKAQELAIYRSVDLDQI